MHCKTEDLEWALRVGGIATSVNNDKIKVYRSQHIMFAEDEHGIPYEFDPSKFVGCHWDVVSPKQLKDSPPLDDNLATVLRDDTETIKLHFYCGCYKQVFLNSDEMDSQSNECSAEGIIEVSVEEWQEESVDISCPSCGQELHQSMSHFEEASSNSAITHNYGEIYWKGNNLIFAE